MSSPLKNIDGAYELSIWELKHEEGGDFILHGGFTRLTSRVVHRQVPLPIFHLRGKSSAQEQITLETEGNYYNKNYQVLGRGVRKRRDMQG
ncbi:hypothetical protein Tsubulata_024655 [Turnera subulata]|uniref:Uncharacterized protein n=1 Tax=Turnera subulata TaxID=218843 RepID=A0A9Q0FWB6_9ROSI|nr:hypothetical protein Tsubulata_024655 [Turnera subulata]